MSGQEFTRDIQFSPAFDKRHPDPRKNYGIESVTMCWLLRGPVGVIQFKVSTGWNLPHVVRCSSDAVDFPMATDLGYHSPHPMYDDHMLVSEECSVLGGPCYYDGSTLNAEEPLRLLIEQGHEAVWDHMKNYYKSLFEGGENDG